MKNRLQEKWDILYNVILLYCGSIILWINYDPYKCTLQYEWSMNIKGIYFYFGIDGLSLFFIYLTTFLIPLCLLFNWDQKREHTNFHLLIAIELLLILVFMTTDILVFYILFESVLIPFFIFIGLNAYRNRKIHAAYLLFFYTIAGSIFMLVSILSIYIYAGTTDLTILLDKNYIQNKYIEKLIWISFFIAFAVKIPIFPFHIWLPEAHVEAPTEGSVILAGILLKLGTYGILRFLIPMFPDITLYYSPFVMVLATLGIIYTSFITLRQIDIKRIVAYSSVAHMNLCVLGMFSNDTTAVAGSILLMIGHGVVSGGFFFAIGVLYKRCHTKLIKYYSGLLHCMPLFSTCLFLLTMGNISLPLTSNFIGEFLILYGLYATSNIYGLVAGVVSIFVGTLYSILLFNKLLFGEAGEFLKTKKCLDLSYKEIHLFFLIIIHMLWIGIYPNSFLDIINTYIHSHLY
jgi:proton-translocating NADH-quinone oxidoreductase, chain M